MPKWRRRRFKRLRKSARDESSHFDVRPDNEIVIREIDGDGTTTIIRYKFPKVELPKGVPVWDGEGKPPGDGPWLTIMEMDFNFHRCTVCNDVWNSPHVHTKDDCNLRVTELVLKS